MIYDPSLIAALPVAAPFDIMPPAQQYERDERVKELDALLGDQPDIAEELRSKSTLNGVSDADLSRLFSADIAPSLPAFGPPPQPSEYSQDVSGADFPPAAFDGLQRRVRPGMNELSRYGYDAAFGDPYGADMRNELRTLVRNAPIQGL
jgi:hypothetical protein